VIFILCVLFLLFMLATPWIGVVSQKLIISQTLWSSDQSFWLQGQRSRVRFPALPDFLRIRGSRKGSTQPREDN
jgi:hypothetical protein